MIKEVLSRIPKTKFYGLIAALLAVVLGEIVLTAAIPAWREYFYNVLQNKQQDLFMGSILYFFLLMTGLGIFQGLKVWAGQLVSFEVRVSASKLLLKRWARSKEKILNYTQAQTEALKNATSLYLEIGVEVFISASIVVMLVVANLHNLPVVVAAMIYTAGISVLAIVFNRPLMTSDAGSQSAEGVYREAIGDIANGKGDYSSKTKFVALGVAYYRYIKVVMLYTLFSRVKGSLASVIPYLILAEPYFSGDITLGVFMSGVATFELIVINATILLVLYPNLTKARASYAMVKEFYEKVK